MARHDWYCEDVLSGRLAVERVWEDDLVLAFHHPEPLSQVHVVIIPKQHIGSIMSADALNGDLLAAMVNGVQKTASATGLDKQGFYVRTNIGTIEQNVTPHMHWHVIGPGIPSESPQS